jgi:hypothetical protein
MPVGRSVSGAEREIDLAQPLPIDQTMLSIVLPSIRYLPNFRFDKLAISVSENYLSYRLSESLQRADILGTHHRGSMGQSIAGVGLDACISDALGILSDARKGRSQMQILLIYSSSAANDKN